jgi:drug/metabolite transporter (DMT)-like permease
VGRVHHARQGADRAVRAAVRDGLGLGVRDALLPADRRARPLGAGLVAGDARRWWCLAYIALLTSVVSYLLWGYALARVEASRVAVFTNLQPVVTALIAWAAFGDPLTLHFLVATLCVLAGVALAC